MNAKWASYAPLPLRLILGLGFLYHGFPKLVGGHEGAVEFFGSLGIPAPGLMVYVVGLVEVLGGLALLAGAFVTIAGVLLIIDMLVAMLTFHLPQGGFNFMNQPPGAEVNLLYIAGLLALILGGAGAYSFDGSRAGRAPARPLAT